MEYLKTLQTTSSEVNALGALLTDSNGFTIQASGELPLESGSYIRSLSQRAHLLTKATGEPSNGSPPVVTIETKDRHITVRTIEDQGHQYSLALISDSNQVHAPPKVNQDSQVDSAAKEGHQGGISHGSAEEGSDEDMNAGEYDDEDNREYGQMETNAEHDDDDHNNSTMEDEEDEHGDSRASPHHQRGDSD